MNRNQVGLSLRNGWVLCPEYAHGNSLKKEKCPDGSKDENVFDIMQGVSIALFIKMKPNKDKCKVYHSEVWGIREHKYNWLKKNDINKVTWKELKPKSEFYLFIPRAEGLLKSFNKFIKLTDIFQIKNTGVITSRDKFVIDFEDANLTQRLQHASNLEVREESLKQAYGLRDVREKKLSEARKELAELKDFTQYYTEILYRPFDIRKIFYHRSLVRWPVFDVMRHMMQENLGLITPRQFKEESGAFVSNKIVGHKTVSAYDINYLFPLYLYPDLEKNDIFSQIEKKKEKQSNINSVIVSTLSQIYKKELEPEDFFYYIYATLYSNVYRKKYSDFLKIDFPRIPFTSDYKLFKKIKQYGNELVDLHLLKSSKLDPPTAKYQGKYDNKIEKLKYDEKQKCVYFNKKQYFEGIKDEIWNYQIGGFQVCKKWLKDRKGKKLSLGNIKQYCKIVTAIEKTIETQREIDKIYPKIEQNVIEFRND